MKTIIIYKSYHLRNTERIAKAMAEVMGAELVKVGEILPEEMIEYELIGFGSGRYGGNYHKDLTEFIDSMSAINKDVFIFYTAGQISDSYNKLIKLKLAGKGCKVVDEFASLGEVSPFKFNLNLKGHLRWILGKNKGHPDKKRSGKCSRVWKEFNMKKIYKLENLRF